MASIPSRSLRIGFALAWSALAVHVALTTVAEPPASIAGALDWLYVVPIAVAGLASVARWRTADPDRRAWGYFALALIGWGAAEAHQIVLVPEDAVTAFPSIGDGFFLAFYPLALMGIWHLVRAHVGAVGAGMLLDALIAATAGCALAASLSFGTALRASADDSDPLVLAFNLAYPVGDLALVGALTAGLSMAGWRFGRRLRLVGLGLVLVAVADALFLAQSIAGTYEKGAWIDSLWPAGLLAVAAGAWQPESPRVEDDGGGRRPKTSVAFPLAAVAILAIAEFATVDRIAQSLATMTVLGVVARMRLSLRENHRLLEASRRDALTDALTGLPNRRRLNQDLEAAVRAGTEHHLFLFDLDGFKRFNDAFGHLAGDQLLVRRAGALTEALGDGAMPYRLGGDEFCVLARANRREATVSLTAASDALGEEGSDYQISASWGAVELPAETADATHALVLADRRMYDRKRSRQAADQRVALRPAC